MRLIAAAVLLAVISITLVACSGSGTIQGPLNTLNITPDLPLPADIPMRSASALTAALTGSSFETVGLVPHFVSVAGSSALFEPPGGETGFGYAMYAFELTDYSGEQSLTNAWTTGPTTPGALWIALSDWQQDTWVWFAAEADSGLVIPDIAQYMNEADMLLAVVLVNIAGAYNLDMLYFTEFPPVIEAVSPISGSSGTDQVFSVTAEGLEPFTYAWDFGGGATPNISSDASPTVLLEAEGTYNASLTLANFFGEDTFLFDLEVIYDFEPGTGQIIAEAVQGTTQVGVPVQIVVSCGGFPHPFKYMNGVAVTVEEGAEYEDLSLNVGAPGGGQKDADGVWTHVNPSTFLLPEDWLYNESPVTGEPGLIYIAFNVIPIGGDNTYEGGELFNFEMNFSAAGTYTLGILEFQTVKRTYYSDGESNEYYWNNITNAHEANTIVVSE